MIYRIILRVFLIIDKESTKTGFLSHCCSNKTKWISFLLFHQSHLHYWLPYSILLPSNFTTYTLTNNKTTTTTTTTTQTTRRRSRIRIVAETWMGRDISIVESVVGNWGWRKKKSLTTMQSQL